MHVIVCDDHPVVRQGLARIMCGDLTIESLREAENGQALLDLVGAHVPDVIVLDVGLPGRGGLDVLRQLKQEWPRLPVLMLSVHPADHYAIRALRAGASGYLTKDLAAAELVTAVRAVTTGHRYVTPDVADRLAEDLGRPTDRPPHDALSDREFEVLRLIGAGNSVTRIAEELCLSDKTISTYRARILQKLHLKSSAEIVRYAIRHGLSGDL